MQISKQLLRKHRSTVQSLIYYRDNLKKETIESLPKEVIPPSVKNNKSSLSFTQPKIISTSSNNKSVENIQATIKKDEKVEEPIIIAPDELPKITTEKMKQLANTVIAKISKLKYIEPFLYPVTEAVAPDYFTVITSPMDISTITKKINEDAIKTPMDLHQHISLIFENALIYNAKSSLIHKHAKILDNGSIRILKSVFPEWSHLFHKCKGNESKKQTKSRSRKTRR